MNQNEFQKIHIMSTQSFEINISNDITDFFGLFDNKCIMYHFLVSMSASELGALPFLAMFSPPPHHWRSFPTSSKPIYHSILRRILKKIILPPLVCNIPLSFRFYFDYGLISVHRIVRLNSLQVQTL